MKKCWKMKFMEYFKHLLNKKMKNIKKENQSL